MKYVFIINPHAGDESLQKKVRRIIDKLRQTGHSVTIEYTKVSSDAERFAETADYCDLLVAVGGDGTVNHILNGLYARQDRLNLAIVPAGTVNDFARHFKLPVKESAILNYLLHHQIKRVDLGKANERVFANVVAAGFVAPVGFNVSKKYKKIFGSLAYYWQGFTMALQNLHITNQLTITMGGQSYHYDAYMFIALNSASLGGMASFAPDASCFDGFLDLFVIKHTGIFGATRLLAKLLAGKLDSDKHVEYCKVSSFQVTCQSELITDIDGEVGDLLPLEVKILHAQQNLALPLSQPFQSKRRPNLP